MIGVRGEKGLWCDMYGGDKGYCLGVGCKAHNTGWVTGGWVKWGGVRGWLSEKRCW
jgi:hypothetical protein